ncbi:MAG: DUF1553 domain-containing protein [Planctomycetota bacterium]|nr:DUF1553 domain-containing protein [Planctomycetota bacterium]
MRILGFCIAVSLLPIDLRAQDAPGLGPAGNLTSLVFEATNEPILHGPDSRRQLLVTGKYSSGQEHDLTPKTAFSVAPAGVLTIGADGFATPVGEGKATVTAMAAGQTAKLELTVERFNEELPINFPNQIVPVLTKLGCNTGGCHGKANGQNGFKLSLLGFYPHEDYEYLVKENQGRRIFPSSPEFSLLLTKPANLLPHGGGKRIDPGSFEWQLITRWIEQGTPYGNDTDPTVERIEVFPKTRRMNRGADQQLVVVAHYSDGSTQDVSRMVKFDSNDSEMAEVTATGLVKTQDVPGEVAVMVRFRDHVTVFRAVIPMGVKFTSPANKNFVDEHVFARLQTLGIPPSPVCDDATFIRRVTVDIGGRLPTAKEVADFLASKVPQKRDQLIDRLVASPDYADLFANKWTSVLRNQRTGNSGKTVTIGFHKFVRDAMVANMPYSQFVNTLLTATGDARAVPAANWFAQVPTAIGRAEDVSQLFLGLRIQCARCHHHPFEKWTQDDYYGLTAFFTQIQGAAGKQKADKSMVISFKPAKPQSLNPRTKQNVSPTPLDAEPLEIDPKVDARIAFAGWLTGPENKFFARTVVNRYWKHFFGRGIVEPEDDMRVTNPPSNPALLDALESNFIKSGFNLKLLVQTICRSNTYQLTSIPNDFNADDKQNYSRHYARRFQAEVLLDSIDQVTNSKTVFKDLPAGTRAIQLPDNSFDTYFLSVFGKPKAATACECERTDDANLAQSLHLLNSPEVQAKLSAKGARAELLSLAQDRPHTDRITEMYHWVYARPPKAHELELIQKHLDASADMKQAYEDVLWALLNTKEFLFNH